MLSLRQWIPAFAGMTIFRALAPNNVIPAKLVLRGGGGAGIHFPCLSRSERHAENRLTLSFRVPIGMRGSEGDET